MTTKKQLPFQNLWVVVFVFKENGHSVFCLELDNLLKLDCSYPKGGVFIRNKVGLFITAVFLFGTPIAMYSFHLFPGVFTYETTETQLFVRQGVFQPHSISLDKEDFTQQELSLITHSIDSLQARGFMYSSLLAMNVGFVLFSWHRPKWRILFLVIALALIPLFSFLYLDQIQSIKDLLP
ncbi:MULTISPECIES: hypothetical protein [Bacillaceae]|uniref:Uncharacterized protein n=1 Tax=Alkalicoccobacillus plakortidis TaxID=444060 RepID=A0A9D5DQW1_9BACI|nr:MULTISPECIES: hypothetical protein [Bacillaceae]KQL58703.1 hypothetical protein AN965_01650 [Alkalicoccobacillus plakortidis]